LVLTFINTLKDDLDRNLGDVAKVFTLHGYCQHLLHNDEQLRIGLSKQFTCHPGLRSLDAIDWRLLRSSPTPKFIDLMRNLTCSEEQQQFYLERTNYYDTVDFDDSVHRVYQQLLKHPDKVRGYALVLIDEFQDFNKLEAGIIDLLSKPNSIVVAGDDDQALYSQLRGASWDHIRAHYTEGHYKVFELPFCMRCPEVIVGAVGDIILKAQADKKLSGRIDKPYRYYPPVKSKDSALYPHIDLIKTSVQRANANYFGKYIEECIRAIPQAEVEQAREKHEPVVLVIGSNPYRRQVEEYLLKVGLITKKEEDELSPRESGLEILNENPKSNLGWRIILACGEESIAGRYVCQAAADGVALADLLPDEERKKILHEAAAWAAARQEAEGDLGDKNADSVAVTSYEGSKGRSASYVFLIGLHSGELPSKASDIKDIEICRFLVGLTRTKKKCSVLVTRRFSDKFKRPSEFLSWVKPERFDAKTIDADYWKKRA
jgi:superfamily I DNA/RNA helicase